MDIGWPEIILFILIPVLFIFLIVRLVTSISKSRSKERTTNKLLEMAGERYVRGEISKEQYDQMKKDLTSLPTPQAKSKSIIDQGMRVSAITSAPIHEEPNPASVKVGDLFTGDIVSILDEVPEFYHIRLEVGREQGLSGYVSKGVFYSAK